MRQEPDQICQSYLSRLYQSAHPYADAEKYKKQDLSATQGEILYGSVNKLLSELRLSAEDVFYDLGSGTGRVTAQVFLNTVVKEACGIELIPELYQKSQEIAAQIQKELPEFYGPERKLHFIQGDFLEISFERATVVFINSVCFNQQTLFALGKLIDGNQNIHTLLSLRPLPQLQGLRFIKTSLAEGNWDSALCYFYKKIPPS